MALAYPTARVSTEMATIGTANDNKLARNLLSFTAPALILLIPFIAFIADNVRLLIENIPLPVTFATFRLFTLKICVRACRAVRPFQSLNLPTRRY